MTKPIVRVHNIETNEIIDREMNDAEFAQYQADQEAVQTRQAEDAAKAAAKTEILNRLGLTEEEAKLLLS